MNPADLTPAGKALYDRMEHEDEELLGEIRKHPIGLVMIYATGIFIIGVMIILTLMAGAFLNSEVASDAEFLRSIVIITLLVLTGLAAAMTLISAYLYRSNVILITTEKIAQILNPSLFNRKISQLGIGDIQDVTVTQQGIFPHIFNYGKLVIETAGEQANYIFTYVPDPYVRSKIIIQAQEANRHRYGN